MNATYINSLSQKKRQYPFAFQQVKLFHPCDRDRTIKGLKFPQ